MSLKIARHFVKRFGKSYYCTNYSVVLFDYYGIYKQKWKTSMTISKTSPANFQNFKNLLIFFSLKISSHTSSYIAANVKDTIHAMLTVLSRLLWQLRYRWVKCGRYPALLPAFYPLSHRTPHFTHNRRKMHP